MNEMSEIEKYNVIIIGAGKIAALFDDMDSESVLTHAHAFLKNPAFELKGFFDANYESAQRAAKRWRKNAYANLDDAMVDVDVVCCCVPDEFHYETLKQISNYPIKLVVAEKPLACTLKEANEIKQLFFDKLILNFSRRFISEFQDLKTKIPSYGTFVKGVGYYGKGINHNGSHMIDLLHFFLGQINDIEYSVHEIRDFATDVSCDIVLRIGDGVFDMLAIDSRIATIFEMDLFFEKARIRILDGGENIEIYNVCESEKYSEYYNYKITDRYSVDYNQALVGLVENVQHYLQHKESLICTVDDGIEVMRVCKKIERSMQ